YLKMFTGILKDNKKLYSAYIGFKDDRFYEVIKLDINKELRKKYNAKNTDKWLEIAILEKGIKTISLFDANFQMTSKISELTKYRPTQRPWYDESMQKDTVTLTGPYQFSTIDARGLTYAKKINNGNIFAVDVLMSDYSNLLKSENIESTPESFIFMKDGTIVASSSSEKKIFLYISEKIKNKRMDSDHQSIVKIDNEEYICNISIIDNGYKVKEYLLTYAPLEEMQNPFVEKFSKMDQALIFLMIGLLPLIWYFSSVIAKPIILLAEQSQKVKDREFDKIIPVHSSVTEVQLLSKSIESMAQSISEYQTDLEQKVTKRTIELEEKNKELEVLSITDKLTNTYNRIKLDSTIDTEIERALRYNTKFGIIIIDIDYFKIVNDTYGHQVGDMILVEFANILKGNTRKTDIVGRWGGEEFIIISPEADLKELLSLSEILREKIATNVFSVINHKTASFGVSTYRKNETVEEFINRADEALYKAKDNGRNKVETLENHTVSKEQVWI
ncbi:diguanylate cyclase, partial [Arcobacteraceae bacterium]|nr:diguanylate cyclase [Arcobacteraceae bacterium]